MEETEFIKVLEEVPSTALLKMMCRCLKVDNRYDFILYLNELDKRRRKPNEIFTGDIDK